MADRLQRVRRGAPPMLLAAAVLVYGAFRARLGVDLTDEGLYVCSAFRLALGDVPFRDELASTFRYTDVLLHGLFRLDPGLTLYELRLFAFAVEAATTALFFQVYRARVPGPSLALVCLIAFAYGNFLGLQTPSYNLLSAHAVFLAVGLSLLALRAGSPSAGAALAIGSGVAAGVAAIAYVPTSAALLAGVVARVATTRRGERHVVALHVVAFLVTVGGFFATAFLLRDVAPIEAARRLLATQLERKVSLTIGAMRGLPELFSFGTVLLVALALSSRILLCRLPRIFPALVVLGLLTTFLGYAWTSADFRQRNLALALVVFLVGTVVWKPAREREGSGDREVAVPVVTGLALMATYALSSHQRDVWSAAQMAAQGLPLVSIPVLVTATAVVRRLGGTVLRPVMAALLAAIAVEGFRFQTVVVYRDAPIGELEHGFETPRLAGILSTAARTAAIDEIVAVVRRSTTPDDFLLAANDLPLLYFLTERRPAIRACWAHADYGPEIDRHLLRSMIEDDRIPRLVVLTTRATWDPAWPAGPRRPARNAIVEALLENRPYRRLEPVGPFEIFRLDDSGEVVERSRPLLGNEAPHATAPHRPSPSEDDPAPPAPDDVP